MTSPRLLRPRSYSLQFRILYFVLYWRLTRLDFAATMTLPPDLYDGLDPTPAASVLAYTDSCTNALPHLSSEFEHFSELRDSESLVDLIDLDEFMSNDDLKAKSPCKAGDQEGQFVIARAPTYVTAGQVSNGRDLGGFQVTNGGHRSLSEVTITLPHTRYLYVDREGAGPIHRESDEVIKLGILRPQESVAVVSWAMGRSLEVCG